MILFTADWHLKLGQKNVPVSWALDRYRSFFSQIEDIHCSYHIIGGDLFDRMPTMPELELYFEFVAGTEHNTIIFDGNHEATRKHKTFMSQLKHVTQALSNGRVEIIDEKRDNFLPYCELHKKDAFEGLDTSAPLFTHVRGEIPPHVKPEVDLDLFNDFPVVFAGDLHSHSNTQRNIVYPGSPMTTSFHRTEVSTGYLLIDENSGDWTWHKFELPQLIRKTVQTPDEMIPTDYHHTIYEIEGDIQDLATVKNTELLDKKIIKRANEATLIMDEDMTITEELSEYLTYILELNEDKIQGIVGTFHDYSKDFNLE